MIKYCWNGHMQRIFICDACGHEITDPQKVRLMREAGALPEEPSFYLHVDCIACFVRERGGTWEPFLLTSPTAAWYT